MTKPPAVPGRVVIRALSRAGFVLDRIVGSHHVMTNSATGRTVSVPLHGGRDLKLGTLKGIIEQAGLTIDEFIALL